MENIDNILSLRVPHQRDEAISSNNICSKYFLFISALVFLILILPGCGSFHFYTQAIHGQYKILMNRQPIDEIIADPDTSHDLRAQLRFALDIRAFAIESLKLPGEDHYRTYVDVNRPYVAWAVFAAPEFSMDPKIWCYPIIGCAVYRGYFSKKDADAYAEQLKQHGFDVYVAGIRAYSTLGWFDDPLLNTFIHKGKNQLAALMFHELAHHIFYVKDDTTFNESFARTVEQEGMRRWFIKENDPGSYKKYMDARKRHNEFIQLLMKYRQTLATMYDKNISISEKREQKKLLFNQLNAEYRVLKLKWNGFSGYDKWFNGDLNNAKMITVVAYNDLVPVFQNILKAEGGDLNRFYEKCKDLAEKPKNERASILNQYSAK